MLGDRWGTTDAELALSLPGDALLGPRAVRADRAVSVAAPAGVVFRWLAQLRVAPYSYDWIDNFGRRSPGALTPGLEELRAGQRFMRIFVLDSFAPDEHLTLRSGRRTAVSYAVRAAPGGTRLLARLWCDVPVVLAAPLVLGDLVMIRRQLLNLKALAERDAALIG